MNQSFPLENNDPEVRRDRNKIPIDEASTNVPSFHRFVENFEIHSLSQVSLVSISFTASASEIEVSWVERKQINPVAVTAGSFMTNYMDVAKEIFRPAKAKRNETKSQDHESISSSARSSPRNKKRIAWRPFSGTKPDSDQPRKSGTFFKSRRRRELESKKATVTVTEIKKMPSPQGNNYAVDKKLSEPCSASTSMVSPKAAPLTVEPDQPAFAVMTPYTEPPTPEELYGDSTITARETVESMNEVTSRALFPSPSPPVATIKIDTTLSGNVMKHLQGTSEATLQKEGGEEEEQEEEEAAFIHQHEDIVKNHGAVLIFDRTTTTKSNSDYGRSPQPQHSLKWILRATGAILAVAIVYWVTLFVVRAILSLGKSTLHVVVAVVSGLGRFLVEVRRLAFWAIDQVLWCAVLTGWYALAWQQLRAHLEKADGFKLPHELREFSKLDATPIVEGTVTNSRNLIGLARGEANPAAEVLPKALLEEQPSMHMDEVNRDDQKKTPSLSKALPGEISEEIKSCHGKPEAEVKSAENQEYENKEESTREILLGVPTDRAVFAEVDRTLTHQKREPQSKPAVDEEKERAQMEHPTSAGTVYCVDAPVEPESRLVEDEPNEITA